MKLPLIGELKANPFAGLVGKAKERSRGSGWSDEATGQIHTTPWAWRTSNGMYIGWDRSVWVYRSLRLSPLAWSGVDSGDRLAAGHRLGEVFRDISALSPPNPLPGSLGATSEREFHLVAVTWNSAARPPVGTPPALAQYQQDAFGNTTFPRRSVLLGIRLRPNKASRPDGPNRDSVIGQLWGLAVQILGEDVPDLDAYRADFEDVHRVLARTGAEVPTRSELRQLESWYNLGRGPEAVIVEEGDRLIIDDLEEIQIAGLSDFGNPVMHAPRDSWLLDALAHVDAPHLISIRGQMQHSATARTRFRAAQRWAYDQAEQEAISGDIGRSEVGKTLDLSEVMEDHYANTPMPLLTNTSILFARRTSDVAETYADMLRTRYDIEVSPLLWRQLDALDETLPTSGKRVNPWPQELSVEALVYSGVNGWSELGDRTGLLIGTALDDGTPIFLDPLGAPKANLPASMAVLGDSGSGKAQPLDAKILTPGGWTTMGEIKVGDKVIGADGKAHTVVGVYPQGVKEAYRVTFNDGSSTVTCDEHLWAVRTGSHRRRGQGYRVKTLAQIVAEGLTWAGKKNKWEIPVVQPVHHPERDLALDPYVLGALLGDGGMTTTSLTLTSADPDLVAEVSRLLPPGVSLSRRGAITYGIRSAHPLIRELATIGYEVGSAELPEGDDKQLIAGAMLAKWTRRREVADDIGRRIRSLGYSAEVVPYRTIGGEAWSISTDIHLPEPDGVYALAGFAAMAIRDNGHEFYAAKGAIADVESLERLLPSPLTLTFNGNAVRVGATVTDQNPVTAELRRTGLLGKRSHEKHIPGDYLIGSVEQRTALLQGLLDTDGTVTQAKHSSPVFTTASRRLADDVIELVRSLGGVARLTSKGTSYVSKEGARVAGRKAYNVTICLPEQIVPFRLPRKAAIYRPRTKYLPARYITGVEYVGETEMQCIAVDAPDHLYVTDDHVVTHNTFFLQNAATQGTLYGIPVIMVNPKGSDSLAPFAEAVGGSVVHLSQIEEGGGYFDPFRYAPPNIAAEQVARHIIGVLSSLTEPQQIELQRGLQEGASAGARCAGEALRYVNDPAVRQQVEDLARSNSQFGLGIAWRPQPPLRFASKLTLVEFDRELGLPPAGKSPRDYNMTERISLATIRLIIRAALEIAAGGDGGMVIIDEAWTLLNQPEGREALERIGREGRSLNVLPILATQYVADVVDRNMEGLLSRVVCLKLSDRREAEAGLRLVGLQPTDERVEYLAAAGPKNLGEAGVRPALGIFRDLSGERGAFAVHPVPPAAVALFRTDPEGRAAQRAAAEAMRMQEPGTEEAADVAELFDFDMDEGGDSTYEPASSEPAFVEPAPGFVEPAPGFEAPEKPPAPPADIFDSIAEEPEGTSDDTGSADDGWTSFGEWQGFEP